MTDKDFYFLEELYEKASLIKNSINVALGDDYVRLKQEFDELDGMDQFMSQTSQKIKPFKTKVKSIKDYILLKTNGVVHLSDELVIAVIEKSCV